MPTADAKFPIKGFVETSFSDWPGKVSAVLFFPLCNLRCVYCHNYDLVLRPDQFPDYPWEAIREALRARRGWIDGVCLTGGEPTLHSWLPEVMKMLKDPDLGSAGSGLAIKLDTTGTHPELLQSWIDGGWVDYVAMDLKAPLNVERYSAVAGRRMDSRDLARIEESLDILLSGKIPHEFRTTIAPAIISEEEILVLAHRIEGADRYTLQNLNPRQALDPAFRSAKPWDEKDLRRIQNEVNYIIKKGAREGRDRGLEGDGNKIVGAR